MAVSQDLSQMDICRVFPLIPFTVWQWKLMLSTPHPKSSSLLWYHVLLECGLRSRLSPHQILVLVARSTSHPWKYVFFILFSAKFVWAFVVVHLPTPGHTMTSLSDLLINFVLICRGTLITCKSLWQNCQQRLQEWRWIAIVTGAVVSSLAHTGAKAELDRVRTSSASLFEQHSVKRNLKVSFTFHK